jgi:hypothetical protein
LSLDDPPEGTGESLVGDPVSSLRFGAGLRVAPTQLLELGVVYEGNLVPYEFSNQLLHQLIFEAGFGFRL